MMSKDEYLITDAPLKALTVFAMPMILGSFFQQIYNVADSIIVGQFVGSSALAAVGACAALTNVFICVALGAGVGAGVLVSRYFGAREYGKMKTIVPILTSTYDNDVNTYNLTHSQLSYEMYDDLDPDTARSKFSQKVTGKKRFTAKEINKLFNIISGKIA